MSQYSKKLHVRKSGSVQDINLYTTTSDISSGQYLRLRDGSTLLYAALGSTTDSSASSLRVRKSGTIYAVLKESYPTGSVTYSTNVLPKKTVKEGHRESQSKTYQLSLPAGTKKIQVLCYADGNGGGAKIVDVNGVSNIYIVISRTDERVEGENYYWVDVMVYKNSTDNRNNVIGETDKYDGQCKATISWSPTINNS